LTHGKNVDETDLKILRLLRKDARLSFREIGKQISVSTGTVSERVKQMQALGVIKGFVTAVEPSKLGFNVTMLLEIRLHPGEKLDDFETKLTEMEEACCIQYVTGNFDMTLLVRCEDQDHATDVLNSVRGLQGVSNVDSHMVLKSCSLCGRCGCECSWEAPPLWEKES
jgi:DNA-binding Lrp family transcriptional regulator